MGKINHTKNLKLGSPTCNVCRLCENRHSLDVVLCIWNAIDFYELLHSTYLSYSWSLHLSKIC